MKTIYLARHGEAVDVGFGDVHHDYDRHLSVRGVEKMKKQSLGLKRLGVQFDACYASPLVRTQETARLLLAHSDCPLESTDSLGASPALSAVHKILELSSAQHILLVTHQPFVVKLASYLLTGENKTFLQYTTGSMACIGMHSLNASPQGELFWYMNSQIMAALGTGY